MDTNSAIALMAPPPKVAPFNYPAAAKRVWRYARAGRDAARAGNAAEARLMADMLGGIDGGTGPLLAMAHGAAADILRIVDDVEDAA